MKNPHNPQSQTSHADERYDSEEEDEALNFVECVFHAKRRTAMLMSAKVLSRLGIGRDYGHVSIMECDFYRPMMINAFEAKVQAKRQRKIQKENIEKGSKKKVPHRPSY